MRQLTNTFCFLLMSYMSMADCLTTISGPVGLCAPAPATAVYTVNLTGTGWLCGNFMDITLPGTGGTMTSILDANGFELLLAPTASFSGTRLSFPLTVFVFWGTNGCHSINATGGDGTNLFWCGCSDSAVLNTAVGPPPPLTDITLSGGEPATACGDITLCATGDVSCALSFEWNIKGETLFSTNRCITYFLETCPLGTVDVRMSNACGNTAVFEKSFTCEDGGVNPYIDHEIMACKGRYWSADIPGSNVKVVVLNDSGNNIVHNGNEVFFTPTALGPVVIMITFEICGREFTQTLFIQVVDCGPIIKIIEEDPMQNRQDQNETAAINSLEVAIFPNPVVDILNIQFDHSNYRARIYNLKGQLLKEINNLEYTSKIDISNFAAGAYFITLEAAGKIITKKLTKQ